MRRALSMTLSRLFATRYGLAVLLVVFVLGVVGAARLFTGPIDSRTGPSAGGRAVTTVNPIAGDDGEFTAPPTAPPGTVPPTAPPAVRPGAATADRVAAAFAAAWLDHRGVTGAQWLARLKPHATQKLVGELSDVDPLGVPADRVTGAIDLVPRSEQVIEAVVPVDSGTLRLRLVATDGRWLVDGVDWDRG